MNPNDYIRNMNAKTPEELAPYAGQHVAFNDEGTRVVAHGEDDEAVYSMLAKLGIEPSAVVFSYIPGPGEDTWL